MRDDDYLTVITNLSNDFHSRLREGVDVQGDTEVRKNIELQSTTPRGSRLFSEKQPPLTWHFNPRLREEVDDMAAVILTGSYYFNPRLREEVDVSESSIEIYNRNFNPRLREEVDYPFISIPCFFVISIHDSARKSTAFFNKSLLIPIIFYHNNAQFSTYILS